MVTQERPATHKTTHSSEPARLAALRRYGILDSPPEVEYDELATLAARICQTPIALVSLLDETRQWFKSHIGLDVEQTPREQAFCNFAIRDQDLLEVTDACADPRFRDNPLVTGEPGIRFYAGVPLITTDGHALGTLCVIDRRRRELEPQQRIALEILARQVMQQLELRRALQLAAGEAALRRDAQDRLTESNRALEDQVRDRSRVLQATLDRLRDAEIQLHTLFENAAVGLAAVDSATQLQRCNRAFLEIVGADLASCRNRRVADLVSQDDAAELSAGLMDALDSTTSGWLREFRLRSADQKTRWVRFGLVPVVGGKDPNMRGIVVAQNASPAKLAEQERDRFFELSADMFVIAGHDGLIHRINPACQQVLGLEPGQLLGARLTDLVDSADQRKAEGALDAMARGAVRDALYIDLRMRDARERWRIIRWSAVSWREGDRVIAVGRDVTEVVEAESALHALASRLQSIREQERTRISREIHDDLGQRLTALKMDLDMLGQDLTRDRPADQAEALTREMQSIKNLVDTTMDAVRRIAQELRPDVLDALGLAPAIDWLMKDLESRTGLQGRLQAPEHMPRLTDDQTTAVFRIVQESLTNVVRHAQASQVSVLIEAPGDHLRICIEDNGQGFERDPADNASLSLGVLGMRERAASIGAKLRFFSEAGHGVRVELELRTARRRRPAP